ncbi:type II toxin-antitoxin system Phd/YefM family antitoxin [Streptomyces yangpuensis]
MPVSAEEARRTLFHLIKRVNDDHVPVRIGSENGDAVLLSAADYDSWQETVHLLGSPANARRLMRAVARDRAGDASAAQGVEEFQALAGDE